MDQDVVLPDYTEESFAGKDLPGCDAIMQGGVTSGIVYPYAMLEIATKYRFRSIGGTSAGAIAAALGAAAEYGRINGRPGAYMRLKDYADELPHRQGSFSQPSPGFEDLYEDANRALADGPGAVVRQAVKRAVPAALAGAVLLGLVAWPYGVPVAVAIAVLGAILGFGGAIALRFRARYLEPLRALPSNEFGLCTGKTQPGNEMSAITDWAYRAIQDIAFGDPDHPKPLTFGDIEQADPANPLRLEIVTTNLSMRRPHTLPRLGVRAGFVRDEWAKLFPDEVIDYLTADVLPCDWDPSCFPFPEPDALPVIVAMRMSLSFPLLFCAVPLRMQDFEFASVVKGLGGGEITAPIRKVLFSDGGITSNFPIHMFDSPLPLRPTFAFSLEDLMCREDEVTGRVLLSKSAGEGLGVQIETIGNTGRFLWQAISAARTWQDQLLSRISGQRERISRIYLTGKEGGLNLTMPREVSERMMYLGYLAARKFVAEAPAERCFDFDEHRWRRLLVAYRGLRRFLAGADESWRSEFEQFYRTYAPHAESYEMTPAQQQRIEDDLDSLFGGAQALWAPPPIDDGKFPQNSGAVRIVPTY